MNSLIKFEFSDFVYVGMSTIRQHACFNDILKKLEYTYLLFENADIHECLPCNTDTIKTG